MSMSGRRSSPVTREGEDIVGGHLNIEILRLRSLVQSHVSM